MAKLKTNKAVRKRFRITRSGKFMKRGAGKRHLLGEKASKRKRHLRRANLVSGSMEKQLRRLLPYA